MRLTTIDNKSKCSTTTTNNNNNGRKEFKPFVVLLNRDDCQYLVGEQIHGKVILGHDKTKVKKTIQIQLYGEAKISPGLLRRCSFNRHHHNKQEYQEIIVKEIISIQDIYYGRNGSCEIPFMFHIPRYLPGSLKHDRKCQIKYQILVTLDGYDPQEIEIFIHSNPNIPLEQLENPVIKGVNRKIGWIFTEMVRIRCELPRTGYQIGTEIPIKFMIDNRSTKSMSLEIKFQQKILTGKQFRKHNIDKKNKNKNPIVCGAKELISKFVTNIEPFCIVEHITTIPLPSPSSTNITMPIVYNTSKLIHIIYQVQVELKIPWHTNIRCILPVVLTNQQELTFRDHQTC